MRKFPAGTVCWAGDPTNAHTERPVVVLSHEKRPFNETQCTVMCIGTNADQYDHYSPELTSKHLSGISFGRTQYLMPWALYTVAPGTLIPPRRGKLTDEGEQLVKRALISLFKV